MHCALSLATGAMLLAPLLARAQAPPGVWPLPAGISCTAAAGSGAAFGKACSFGATGPGASSDVVVATLARYKDIIMGGGAGQTANALAPASAGGDIMKVTVVVAACAAGCPLTAATDYSYTLAATAGGTEVTATAASPYAAAYALEMLSQLVGKDGKLQCTAFSITDSPEFVHRCDSELPPPPHY